LDLPSCMAAVRRVADRKLVGTSMAKSRTTGPSSNNRADNKGTGKTQERTALVEPNTARRESEVHTAVHSPGHNLQARTDRWDPHADSIVRRNPAHCFDLSFLAELIHQHLVGLLERVHILGHFAKQLSHWEARSMTSCRSDAPGN